MASHYPKLKKKLGLIGASCLMVWGAFILGMQLYVFGYYSRVYGEGTDNGNWGDAYTGMALANSAASLIFGIYYVVAFTEKPTTTKMLLWGIILAVIGSFAAAGSTVLSALEADWVQTSTNVESTHPCKYSKETDRIPEPPTELICTNWFALEVTISVLSGLAFSEYIFIGIVIYLGMSAAKNVLDDMDDYKSADVIIPAARIAPNNNNNNNNNPQSRGQDGPYNAFNYSPPPSAKSPMTNESINNDDINPRYSYHLQQLSLQQQQQSKPPVAQQQQQQQSSIGNYHHQPVRQAPAVPASSSSVATSGANSQQMNRGRLQILHNQRQKPPVPAKPNNVNNSSLYRY